MPRCSHCGKVNRDGSLFCQDCGHRLEAAAKPAPAAVPAAAATVCSACGTANPAGMNFCKMCGTSLGAVKPQPVAEAASSPPASGAASGAGKTTCSACGKQTPSGFAFCQHCGARLAHLAAAANSSPPAAVAQVASLPKSAFAVAGAGAQQLGVTPTMAVNPTPPAGMPRTMAQAAAAKSPVAPPVASMDEALASTMAPPSDVMAAAVVARMPRKDTIIEPPPSVGTLVALNRDGSDGEMVRIVGDAFDIGRTEGSLRFAEDPYLAARHARLVVHNGKITLRPIDTVNGVYLRVSSCELSPNDQFLVGKEVLRFELVPAEEREPPALVEHGVRLFGSAPREAWGRLRQLTVAGTTRDVWHLVRPELVLGREEGDVTFPDDEFMSRRHAALRRQGAKMRLEDLNSSNGTFVRVRADRELRGGDVMRMGDQLLRLEI
jgi:pSer/pThr/pTyr-binding forkhead associated (FHA) protein